MTFASGLSVICADPGCDSTDLEVVRESFDEIDAIFVGEQRCKTCGCAMLFSRRPSGAKELTMAKKAKAARAAKAGRQNWTASRKKTTHRAAKD